MNQKEQLRKHKIKLLISYDGTDFAGWQRQPNGRPTIQGTIEEKLSQIFDQRVVICGAGRTDAGVHAIGQVAHAWLPKNPAPFKLFTALNKMTPPSIAIRGVWSVPEDFHAIASAWEKEYRYFIVDGPTPSAIRARYSLWHPKDIDIKTMNHLSQVLIGQHDFKSFQTSGTDVPNTNRTIKTLEWQRIEPRLIQIKIVGDGFLKQMVRNIVGTLLYFYRESLSAQELKQVLLACDRSSAKDTAPAHGLFLQAVRYKQLS